MRAKSSGTHDIFTTWNRINRICSYIYNFYEEWWKSFSGRFVYRVCSYLKWHLSLRDLYLQWHFEWSACRDISERSLTHEGWKWHWGDKPTGTTYSRIEKSEAEKHSWGLSAAQKPEHSMPDPLRPVYLPWYVGSMLRPLQVDLTGGSKSEEEPHSLCQEDI